MFIDTHAHIDMPQFDNDRDEVITRALKDGVGIILNVGSSLDGSIASVKLAEQYSFIYASVGVHPHDADGLNDAVYEKLESLAKNEKVIAIGETGLDYYKNHSDKDMQKDGFRRHISLAKRLKKPIIIHTREAAADTISILKEEGAEEAGGIFHCFSGDRDILKTAIDIGFYISVAGQVTFPKATLLQDVVKNIPSDRLLIETDSPYLSPQGKRGERCEPSYVKYTASKIAELRRVKPEDIERIVYVNFHTLFNMKIDNEDSRDIKISYQIRDSLYINLTNRCTNRCKFCAKFVSYFVQGHNLELPHEPSIEDIWKAIDSPKKYKEIVFCGFGEPMLRLDAIAEIAKRVKEGGGKVRINTNGHGNLIHKRNILPELAGLVDSISISMNAENSRLYDELCLPSYQGAFDAVLDFISEARKYIPDVTATVLNMPDVINIEECRRIAEGLKVKFRVRDYNIVG